MGARSAGAAAAQRTHCSPGRDELQHTLASRVLPHPQLNADDAVSPRWSALARILAMASSLALFIA